ncbi:hypothetical protein OKN36_09070 [Furfurilactobacillus sp. OKN36]
MVDDEAADVAGVEFKVTKFTGGQIHLVHPRADETTVVERTTGGRKAILKRDFNK